MNSFMQKLVIFAVIISVAALTSAKCDFKAVFNFGDSNSDTGEFNAAFPALGLQLPYGVTYFKKASGRASNGRLIIDFLAQALGLPFLGPYLQSIGSDFRHGVNFAALAAAVRRPMSTGTSPFSLAIQLSQLEQFKVKVDEHHSSGTPLPEPDIFGKSLYTIYIGQNDFTGNLSSFGSKGMTEFLQEVVSEIGRTIKQIYTLGGRTFLVFNLAPLGCYPFVLVQPHNSSDIDSSGCLISCNNAVDGYNCMLKTALEQARQQLPDTNLVHVDTHAVLLQIFKNPTSYGIQNTTTACCGFGGGSYNFKPDVFGGSPTAPPCSDPQNYVNWDGFHLTEAANKILANAILSGSYFDPPFPITEFCDIQPIG